MKNPVCCSNNFYWFTHTGLQLNIQDSLLLVDRTTAWLVTLVWKWGNPGWSVNLTSTRCTGFWDLWDVIGVIVSRSQTYKYTKLCHDWRETISYILVCPKEIPYQKYANNHLSSHNASQMQLLRLFSFHFYMYLSFSSGSCGHAAWHSWTLLMTNMSNNNCYCHLCTLQV